MLPFVYDCWRVTRRLSSPVNVPVIATELYPRGLLSRSRKHSGNVPQNVARAERTKHAVPGTLLPWTAGSFTPLSFCRLIIKICCSTELLQGSFLKYEILI